MATAKQILAMDEKQWLSLSEQEMRKATKILVDVAAKRVKRLEQQIPKLGASPALATVDRGGKFTTKGKNLNQLRQEFMRVKGFLKNYESTVKGFKKIKKQTAEKLKKGGVIISPENESRMWNIYRKYAELDNRMNGDKDFKYNILREIAEYIDDDLGDDTITEKLEAKYHADYEEYMQEIEESKTDFSTAQFFTD